MQKCIKLRIIKPCNDGSWDELGNVLRNVMYACLQSANYVMRECYLSAIAKINNEPVKKKYYYPKLAEMFPFVASHILNATEKMATKKWNQHSKDVLASKVSLPSFKQGLPFHLHHVSYKVIYSEGNYSIDTQLCSIKSPITRFQFVVAANDQDTRNILERIVSGEYSKGEAQITKDRKGKWFFIIPYQLTVQRYDIDKNNIMGVDFGMNTAVYWAFSGSYKRGWITGDEISEFRRRVRNRRISIQQQGNLCGNGRIGHGTARKLLPVDVLREKESNFCTTCNYRYAKRIIDEALRMRCGVIQIENLTGINKLSLLLKTWPYHDLQIKIINKAAEFGIEVRKVNPQFTSQRCSDCGHINMDSQLNQAHFICSACGYGSLFHCCSCDGKQIDSGVCLQCGGADTRKLTINADYNAARNLTAENIEDMIRQTLSGQGIKITKFIKDKHFMKC